MGLERFLFTSESVTEGHPDKLADQISDGILDAVLAQDPEGRVAVETLVTTGLVFVTGEITTKADVALTRLPGGSSKMRVITVTYLVLMGIPVCQHFWHRAAQQSLPRSPTLIK